MPAVPLATLAVREHLAPALLALLRDNVADRRFVRTLAGLDAFTFDANAGDVPSRVIAPLSRSAFVALEQAARRAVVVEHLRSLGRIRKAVQRDRARARAEAAVECSTAASTNAASSDAVA